MNNSLVASVSSFADGILVLRVLGDLVIDIELIAQQMCVNNLGTRLLEKNNLESVNETELRFGIDNPIPLLTQIHEYLNSIGYSMDDEIFGTAPAQ